MVAGSLPTSILADSSFNTTGAHINIVDAVAGGFDSIPGTYADTKDTIAKIHQSYAGKVDLFVHLGRSPWSWVTVERRAFSQEMSSSWLREENKKAYYVGRDNNGQCLEDLGPCPWKAKGVPIGLHTEVDVDAVVGDANAALDKHVSSEEHRVVKPHLEAGAVGCGHCYYESMAHCFVAGRRRNVLFCHVPRGEDEVEIAKDRDAILAIIGASIADLIRQEETEPEDLIMRFGRAY